MHRPDREKTSYHSYNAGLLQKRLNSGVEVAGACRRFVDVMLVEDATKNLLRDMSLGEGGTPLISLPLDRGLVRLKMESYGPTGSFKDRGAAAMVVDAVANGVGSVAIDSSGNAGTAVAAIASRCNVPCAVFMPSSNSVGKQRHIQAVGGDVHLVDGPREASEAAARAYCESGQAAYLSHSENPVWLHGVKTVAFEIWEQCGGKLPDVVVAPVGHGTLFLGFVLGARDLIEAGLVDRLPRMVAVRSEAASGWTTSMSGVQKTIAEGIAIKTPAYAATVRETIESSKGGLIVVSDKEIERAQDLLARNGLLAEPTAAVGVAAINSTRFAELEISKGTSILTFICGSGMKTLAGPSKTGTH